MNRSEEHPSSATEAVGENLADEATDDCRRTSLQEIGSDELPAGYQYPETLAPYVKRPLETVRFLRRKFVIGNDRMLEQLISQGLGRPDALRIIAATTKPYPILTEEEERDMRRDVSKGLDELFGRPRK